MTDPMTSLESLAAQVEAADELDNSLDVLVEIALFKPGGVYSSCRSNAAGTKVIYTDPRGRDVTCWAQDWTKDRLTTAAALRARARSLVGEGEA